VNGYINRGSEFSVFESYVTSLEDLARELLLGRTHVSASHSALNGAPSHELRKSVPLDTRREIGAFFTTSSLRDGAFGAMLPVTR